MIYAAVLETKSVFDGGMLCQKVCVLRATYGYCHALSLSACTMCYVCHIASLRLFAGVDGRATDVGSEKIQPNGTRHRGQSSLGARVRRHQRVSAQQVPEFEIIEKGFYIAKQNSFVPNRWSDGFKDWPLTSAFSAVQLTVTLAMFLWTAWFIQGMRNKCFA